MGIAIEFVPDLCLRLFGTEGRDSKECLPEKLVVGDVYNFLKKGQRNFWMAGEFPLRETRGGGILSKPLASVVLLEAAHFVKDGEVWTCGRYKIMEVYDPADDKIHFDGLEKIGGIVEKEKKVVRVGVGTIVLRDNKVLLGKRKGSHGEGTWCFPGGHLEMFEGFGECAKRETMEETGLEIEMIDEAPVVTNDFFDEEGKHYITVFVRANYIDGEAEIMEPNKCDEWRWFEWVNMPKNLFVPIKNLKEGGYNPFER